VSGRAVNQGQQHELRLLCIGQVQRPRNSRALLGRHGPLPTLDERDLIHANGAFGACHEVGLRQVLCRSNEPKCVAGGVGGRYQLRDGQGHR